jgi:hypothetical protein
MRVQDQYDLRLREVRIAVNSGGKRQLNLVCRYVTRSQRGPLRRIGKEANDGYGKATGRIRVAR